MNFFLNKLKLTPEHLQEVRDALGVLETRLGGLPTLSTADKRSLRPMGQRNEAFCRRSLNLLQLNPTLLPPKVPLADAANELLVLDTLRPLLERIAKLNLRSLDAQFVAGSEVFAVALEGYKQMRRHGDDEGLRLACKEMGTLFAKSSAKAKAARARATAEPDVPAVHPPA